jgi:hypothetical protein
MINILKVKFKKYIKIIDEVYCMTAASGNNLVYFKKVNTIKQIYESK